MKTLLNYHFIWDILFFFMSCSPKWSLFMFIVPQVPCWVHALDVLQFSKPLCTVGTNVVTTEQLPSQEAGFEPVGTWALASGSWPRDACLPASNSLPPHSWRMAKYTRGHCLSNTPERCRAPGGHQRQGGLHTFLSIPAMCVMIGDREQMFLD